MTAKAEIFKKAASYRDANTKKNQCLKCPTKQPQINLRDNVHMYKAKM